MSNTTEKKSQTSREFEKFKELAERLLVVPKEEAKKKEAELKSRKKKRKTSRDDKT